MVKVLKSTPIGYLSVTSKKGDLYSYPVAFHYADLKIYLMTPIGSAKMKFIKANPNISFIVDNKKLALGACGAMVQGRAKVFSIGKLITSIISMGPKMMKFAKKYPGMFTFYARGKELPEERKLYKYRLIRIDPTKVVYWTGYIFGKYVPEKPKKKERAEGSLDLKDESKVSGIAGLLESADEELEMDQLPMDEDWLGELKAAASSGILSEDERRIISSYRMPKGVSDAAPIGKVSAEEKSILKRWKASSRE